MRESRGSTVLVEAPVTGSATIKLVLLSYVSSIHRLWKPGRLITLLKDSHVCGSINANIHCDLWIPMKMINSTHFFHLYIILLPSNHLCTHCFQHRCNYNHVKYMLLHECQKIKRWTLSTAFSKMWRRSKLITKHWVKFPYGRRTPHTLCLWKHVVRTCTVGNNGSTISPATTQSQISLIKSAVTIKPDSAPVSLQSPSNCEMSYSGNFFVTTMGRKWQSMNS